MRYNPCGRVVDFGRRAYSTACRFLRDDDTVSQIRWVEARPDAPVLGRVARIMSLDDECDPWLPTDVGEVDGAPRPFTGQKAPVGLNGDHVCGSDEDFELGGTLDEEAPEVRYGALGFPLCCAPPLRLRGGAGASGRALYVLKGVYKMRGGAGASGRAAVTVTPGLRLYGGAGASGRAAVSFTSGPHLYGGAGASGRAVFVPVPWVEPAEGGLEIGGEAGEEYTPGMLPPGTTCADATPFEMDVLYRSPVPVGEDWWYKCELAADTTYHLDLPDFAFSTTLVMYGAGDCPSPSFLVFNSDVPTCRYWTTTDPITLRLRWRASTLPRTIAWKLSVGPCV